MLPRVKPGNLVFQLKVDYTEVISRIAGRGPCPGCSALDDLAATPLKELGNRDRHREALVAREDDREKAVWEGLATFRRSLRRVLNCLASSGRPVCELDGSDLSSEPLSGRMSGCMVLE